MLHFDSQTLTGPSNRRDHPFLSIEAGPGRRGATRKFDPRPFEVGVFISLAALMKRLLADVPLQMSDEDTCVVSLHLDPGARRTRADERFLPQFGAVASPSVGEAVRRLRNSQEDEEVISASSPSHVLALRRVRWIGPPRTLSLRA